MKRAGLGGFVVAMGLAASAVAACVGDDPAVAPLGTSTSGDGGASSSGGSGADGSSQVQQDGAAADAPAPPIEHCVEGKSECTQFEESGGDSTWDHATATHGCNHDISTAQSKSATHSARLFCQGPVADIPAQGTIMFAPDANGHDALHIEFDFFAKALPPVPTELFVLSSVPASLGYREESFIISADSTGWKIRNDLDTPSSPSALGMQPNLGEWNHAVIDVRFATASAGGSFEMTLDGKPAASVHGAKTASGAPGLDMAIELGPYILDPITTATLFEIFVDNVEVDVH